MSEIIEKACHEAEIYKKANLDGIMLENMHDLPYLPPKDVSPEIIAAMAVVATKVKEVFRKKPVGIQILAGANESSLAVAKASGLDFIRAEGFVFSHIADEGLMNSCAGSLMRYRKKINAEDILVFTDIKKKHSAHTITSDIDITEMAKAAQFFLSDGVIVTGSATGAITDEKEVQAVLQTVDIPVLVGSGVTLDNVSSFLNANGLIIGSYFKEDGNWAKDLNPEKVTAFMKKVEQQRNN